MAQNVIIVRFLTAIKYHQLNKKGKGLALKVHISNNFVSKKRPIIGRFFYSSCLFFGLAEHDHINFVQTMDNLARIFTSIIL